MNENGKLPVFQLLLVLLIGLAGGFGGAALWSMTGMDAAAHRNYIMANPEVLPEAMRELQNREARARIAPARAQLEAAYPGAVLGNPDGALTLVEFSDYACGYCRGSVEDVEQLIRENPDLRVVIREYPILAPESADAARMALAAADQGKFAAFHSAMFAAGRPSAETIAAAATEAGLDLGAARAAIEAGKYEAELTSNVGLARSLGFDGTPSWVIGDNGLVGAQGLDVLREAVANARS